MDGQSQAIPDRSKSFWQYSFSSTASLNPVVLSHSLGFSFPLRRVAVIINRNSPAIFNNATYVIHRGTLSLLHDFIHCRHQAKSLSPHLSTWGNSSLRSLGVPRAQRGTDTVRERVRALLSTNSQTHARSNRAIWSGGGASLTSFVSANFQSVHQLLFGNAAGHTCGRGVVEFFWLLFLLCNFSTLEIVSVRVVDGCCPVISVAPENHF